MRQFIFHMFFLKYSRRESDRPSVKQDIPTTSFLPHVIGTPAGSIALHLHHVMHHSTIPTDLKHATVTVSLDCLVEDAIMAIEEEFSEQDMMKIIKKRPAERDDDEANSKRGLLWVGRRPSSNWLRIKTRFNSRLDKIGPVENTISMRQNLGGKKPLVNAHFTSLKPLPVKCLYGIDCCDSEYAYSEGSDQASPIKAILVHCS